MVSNSTYVKTVKPIKQESQFKGNSSPSKAFKSVGNGKAWVRHDKRLNGL